MAAAAVGRAGTPAIILSIELTIRRQYDRLPSPYCSVLCVWRAGCPGENRRVRGNTGSGVGRADIPAPIARGLAGHGRHGARGLFGHLQLLLVGPAAAELAGDARGDDRHR